MELKGSKTEQNLMAAFAGESQARNKYTYYASKAKKEGYEQIAALFEETGRLIAMKFFMKDSLNKQNSVMYGIGHGGIEAILLVGLTYISNLLTAVMINSGALQNSMALLDEATQQTSFQQIKVLWELPAWQFYMAGVERTIAIILQISLSVLVYKAVSDHSRKFWFLAFGIHFAVDFLTVVISGLGAPVWIVEAVLLVSVAFVAMYAYKLYKKEESV